MGPNRRFLLFCGCSGCETTNGTGDGHEREHVPRPTEGLVEKQGEKRMREQTLEGGEDMTARARTSVQDSRG